MSFDWSKNIFFRNADAVNNNQVKEAMKDGNITAEEYNSLFPEEDVSTITEDKLNDIEDEYNECIKFLKNSQNTEIETNDTSTKDTSTKENTQTTTNQDTTVENNDQTIDISKPSGLRKANKPDTTVDLSGNKEALEAKLKTEESKLQTNEKTLSDILSGNDTELANLQKDIDSKYEKYQELLNEVEPELAKKVDDKKKEIDTKKEEINKKEQEISNKDGEINEAETTLSNAKTNRDNIKSSISEIEAAISKCGNSEEMQVQKAYYAGLLETKKVDLAAAEEAVTNAETDLAKKEEEYDKLVKEKDKLDTELKTLEDEMTKLEKEVAKLNNEEINKAKEEYDKAQDTYDTKKETKTTEAKSAVAESRANVQALETKINQIEAEEKRKEEMKEAEKKAEVAKELTTADNNMTTSVAPSGGTSGASGSSSAGGANSTQSAAEIRKKEIEEAQKSYDTAKSNFDTKNEELKDIYTGEDAEVKAAKENANKSFDDLQTALKTNGHDALAEQLGTVKTNLDSKMSELDNVNLQILEQENALANAETGISKNNATISAYETKLSELKGADTSNMSAEQKTKLNENIAEIETKIKEAKEANTNTLKQTNDTATQKIADLKAQKTKLEDEVTSLNNELEGLLAQVPADCKAEADAFKTAQKDYTTIKSTKEANAKSAVETARTEMNDADKKLSSLKDADAVAQYKTTAYNEEAGKHLLDSAYKMLDTYGSTTYLCATGVSRTFNIAYGIDMHGNGCDWDTNMDKLVEKGMFVEATDEYPSASDLANLPAGAVVCWEATGNGTPGGTYGHVTIADGNGGEISDHHASNIYKSVGGRSDNYKVYLPI